MPAYFTILSLMSLTTILHILMSSCTVYKKCGMILRKFKGCKLDKRLINHCANLRNFSY